MFDLSQAKRTGWYRGTEYLPCYICGDQLYDLDGNPLTASEEKPPEKLPEKPKAKPVVRRGRKK